jgi:phosphopantetheinyl transferase
LYAHLTSAVGVDVSQIQSIHFVNGILPMLSCTDRDWILDDTSSWSIPTKTHIIWAIKEAYCKMNGTGLDLEWLCHSTVHFTSDHTATIQETHLSYHVTDKYILAYTYPTSPPPISVISPSILSNLYKKAQWHNLRF